MRRPVVAAALLVGFGAGFVRPPAVVACSCSETTVAAAFTGEAVEEGADDGFARTWRFLVTSGTVGVAAADVVEVTISGEDPPSGGVQVASSCSLGRYPVVGGTYDVTAYRGTNVDGSSRLFANGCGGHVRELRPAPPSTADEPAEAAPRAQRPGPAAAPGSETDGRVAAAAAGVVAVALLARRALARRPE